MTNEYPAPFLQFDNFLSDEAVANLIEFVRLRESDLAPSTVLAGTGDEDKEVRRSHTLFDLGEMWPLFESQLEGLLPSMRRELDVPHFQLHHTERQLTVHHDGDFFGPHNDNGGPQVSSRLMTYVYYFNIEPCQFEGGELWMYNSFDQNGMRMQGEDHVVVEPRHNSIVFFPSWVHHEVRPVKSLTEGLEGCRMTFNGWYHTEPVEPPKKPVVIESDPDKVAAILREKLPKFTDTGFAVVDTPPEIQRQLAEAYTTGLADAHAEGSDATYLTAGDPNFIDIDNLGYEIGAELQAIHQEWSGQELELTAAYGIRTYRRGQVLRRHVDRFETHVISSVVHIDNESDEPWPLHIEDHDGKVHEVCLKPGQILLYESAVCAHSRPTPFAGEHYGSLFLHFKPTTDWNYTSEQLLARPP
ncbi:MAG: 2OG-Fe(II) oxygenase [Acidimicrobiales bacterium]